MVKTNKIIYLYWVEMAEKDEGGGKAEVNFSCGLFLLLRCSLQQKA